jgi:putative nucleotidyltransferase with HDIG domain
MSKSLSSLTFLDLKRRDHWSKYTRDELETIGGKLQEILLAPNCKELLFNLDNCGFFDAIIPELADLKKVPQHKQNSRNALHHSVLVVQNVPDNPVLKWAALLHDIGKIYYKVNSDGTLNFRNHEFTGAKLSKGILKRMKIKNSGDICRLVQFHSHPLDYQRQPNWRNDTVRKFVDKYNHLASLLVDLAISDKIASSGKSEYLEPLYALRHMIGEISYDPNNHSKEEGDDQITI